jgi:hypothetical protein
MPRRPFIRGDPGDEDPDDPLDDESEPLRRVGLDRRTTYGASTYLGGGGRKT